MDTQQTQSGNSIADIKNTLTKLGIKSVNPAACTGAGLWIDEEGLATLDSINPTTGEMLARVRLANREIVERIVGAAQQTFQTWRNRPAPARGQLVRDLGIELRDHIEPLSELVTLETGKPISESVGEVQEMIDVCDFAVGLSRQLCGSTMHSERPEHRMYEQWHPLGPIGIITAFNFPVAVWSWNAALAAVCGDSMVWKPSPLTPLCGIAVQNICNRVMSDHGANGVFNLLIGSNEDVAASIVADNRLPLISFTGSCSVGKEVAKVVGRRMGRSLLELGGNNAAIVEPDADLDLAVKAILFAAVGTAGQRCTSTRRVFAHHTIVNQLQERLLERYREVVIGNPLSLQTFMGPLVSEAAVTEYQSAISAAISQGGKVIYGNRRLDRPGFFVEPTIIRMPRQTAQVKTEAFAPILYLMEYQTIEQAIELQNDVPQGLSSSIFTTNLLICEKFLSAEGSDCGIANVNTGTSGAEIGGAFGGEKDTGGGRESGSDAWKHYMRRQTVTINWSRELTLAQNIRLD